MILEIPYLDKRKQYVTLSDIVTRNLSKTNEY